jgi:hypothetical protein
LLKLNSPRAGGAVEEYFSVLAESLGAFRIPVESFDTQKFDEQIVQSIESFLPYRDEFISIISTIARYPLGDNDKPLRTFFEKLVPYMFAPKDLRQWYDWSFDNFRFIIHEMFLYTVAFLLKQERFELVMQLISQNYYVGDAIVNLHEPMQPFSIFYQGLGSLVTRNQRLNPRRLSLRADLLNQRSHTSGMPFSSVMQADFVLYFFNALTSYKEKTRQGWIPETLVYYREHAAPFEIFARSESSRYFQKICPLLAVKNKGELGEAFKLFGYQHAPIYLPHWDMFHSFSLEQATNFQKLATKS